MEIEIKGPSSDLDVITTPPIAYYMTRLIHLSKEIPKWLHSRVINAFDIRVESVNIDRPIFITGLARAGTTITLEMLDKHPDVTNHRYADVPIPYAPHWSRKAMFSLKILQDPVERLHQDGMEITIKSPEAIEEHFYLLFFDGVHDEEQSSILDGNTSNQEFETFYREHIGALFKIDGGSRYMTKNNYCITRMEYLLRLFPDAKFLILIRNPVQHIASIIKQCGVFEEMEDPKMLKMTEIVGHREFGSNRICINTGNTEVIHEIRRLWAKDDSYVRGWALYWKSIYEFVKEQTGKNKILKKAVEIIRFEDLCNNPSKTIDRILTHTELDPEKFKGVKDHYMSSLRQPTYYLGKYSGRELADIAELTGPIAADYGYSSCQ